MAVHDQRMVSDREPEPLRNGRLALFDAGIHELFDAAAVQTDDVIVMGTVIQLEDGHAVLEMMASHQTGRLKLGEYAVDSGQPDILVTIEERAIDVFGRKMSCRAALENFENLEARQGHLQAGFAEVFAFHCCSLRQLKRSRAGASRERLTIG